MSPSVLMAALWCFPPPVPPGQDDGLPPPPPAESVDDDTNPDSPEGGGDASDGDDPSDVPFDAEPADGGPDESADESDEGSTAPADSGDPNLEYGEPGDGPNLEYADEPPPDPDLQYADEVDEPEFRYADADGTRPDIPSEDAIAGATQVGAAREVGQRGSDASPQRFAMELKFGPYLPRVDAAAQGGGFGPYATVFGETDDSGVVNGQPRPGLLSVLSFEWQFYNLGGPFSIGTTVGFFRDSADALLANPGPDENVRSEADSTSFLVVPITVLVGYRFELLADRFKVPIVPYARGGLGYGLWWSFDGTGAASENNAGVPGRGGSFGWQVNLGGMLRLDFISPGGIRELDRTTGINHVYLFGEFQISRLNGFTDGARLAVGDDTWLLGLAVEF